MVDFFKRSRGVVNSGSPEFRWQSAVLCRVGGVSYDLYRPKPTDSLKLRRYWTPPAAFLVFLRRPPLTQQGAADQNWRSYGSDPTNTRYSPLSQIDAGNFSQLQLAWSFSTANLGPIPETNLESTPLRI